MITQKNIFAPLYSHNHTNDKIYTEDPKRKCDLRVKIIFCFLTFLCSTKKKLKTKKKQNQKIKGQKKDT